MTHRPVRLLLALCLVGATVPALHAQTGRTHFGPRISYQLDLEAVGLGAQLAIPMSRTVDFYPSFDLFFPEGDTQWSGNADLKWRAAPASISWLYLGTGLNVARRGGRDNRGSRAGVNLFVGAESRTGRVHPFVEFRYTANDGSTAQLAAGLNFTLAR